MSWDDSDNEPDVALGAGALTGGGWDDEDAAGPVADAWDASDDDEDEPKVKPGERKKKTARELKQEKLERLAREREAEAEAAADPLAEKMRRQRLVELADLRAAEDLFGTSRDEDDIEDEPIQSSQSKPRAKADSSAGDEWTAFKPKTAKDFDMLAKMVAGKIEPHSGSFHYVGFLKELMKLCTVKLKSEEVKQVQSAVAVIANDKLKEEKKADGKKPKKAKKKAQKQGWDDDMVTDKYDAYADFM